MRVVLATWTFPDPTERFIVNHVAGLVERGIDCAVVTRDIVRDADPAIADRVAGIEIATSLDRNVRADVVHFAHTGVALAHRNVLRSIRAAKVVSCHGSDVRIESIGKEWIQAGFADVFAAVDVVHCVSKELAEHCIALGARSDQLHIAPVGVDLRVFSRPSVPERSDALALRLVTVARLDWVKGYEYALHAVRLLLDEGHRVTYSIVGKFEGAEDSVRLAIRDFGLEEVVTLHGHLPPEGVRDVLAAADVFVLASLSEGTPVAVAEAMAMGVPVVVTDVGGVREVVEDGVHGYVVPARDPAALAGAITKLRTFAARAPLADACRISARELSASREIDRLVEIYERLVAPPTPAARPAPVDVVSVVIAAHDAAATIDDQLRALSFQDYEGRWEVVVVDNCSTDDTAIRALSWSNRLPDLRVVDAPDRPNIAYARNTGVRAARGDRVVMCDADDVVAPGWLAAMVGALEHDPLVRGALERSQLLPARYDFGAGLDVAVDMAGDHRPRVLTGNLAMRREVFDAVGGFDESLERGEDLDFGWRALDAGYQPAFTREAIVHYRSQWRATAVARRAVADGRAGAALFARHGANGMPAPTAREVADRYRDLARRARREPWSAPSRVGWVYDVAHAAGRIAGSVEHRVKWF